MRFQLASARLESQRSTLGPVLDTRLDGAAATRGRSLVIHIVATTLDGTRAALAGAAILGRDLDARLILLVPHVVPYAQPLDRPAVRAAFVEERFRRLVETLATDVIIQVCLCRPHSATLTQLLPCDGWVLVGGRRGWLWRTREERLVAGLIRTGRQALFLEQGASARPGVEPHRITGLPRHSALPVLSRAR
jgi:hypothetical protein